MSNTWTDDGDWEVAVDRKKQKSEARRERKEAEAAAAALAGVVGADGDYSAAEAADAAARRAMASASFYLDPTGHKRKVQLGRRAGAVEDEEEVFVGGGPNPRAAKKKSKAPKAAVPSYSTGEELAEALANIIATQPPSAHGSITVASLGDKLQTLTKQAWNKRYKAEFGSLRKFLEARPQFALHGEEVSLAGAAGGKKATTPAKGAAGKQGAKAAKQKQKKAQRGGGDEHDEDESEEEDDDDESAERSKQSGGGGVGTVIAVLVLAIAGAGYLYMQQLKQ